MAAAATRRNWERLEGKIVPPDRWSEFTLAERKVFCLLRGLSDPPSVQEIANELDLTIGEVQEIIDRHEMRAAAPAKRVPVGTFLRLIETAAERVLLAMDKRRVDQADMKSLGSVFRELINARALLLGEPTQIVGSDHRRAMNRVVEDMLLEARRRGIEIGIDQSTGAVVARRPVQTLDVSRLP